jgi:hypothetical protein
MTFRQVGGTKGAMDRRFRVGDRVTFRVGGEDLVMTVAKVYPDHDVVDLTYTVDGQARRLGIIARALQPVESRVEDPCP